MRRRSWSAEESISSSWSARRTTQSGHPLAHADPGDPLDRVCHRLNVLNIDRRDHRNAGVEDLEDVFPTFLVATRIRHIGMRQLIDQHHFGLTGQDRVDIHLLPVRVAVAHVLARHDGEIPDLLDGVGALVCLDESDDDVRPTLEAAPTLVEHGARLADAGRRAEVDPELAGRADTLVFTCARGHVHLSSSGPTSASVHSMSLRRTEIVSTSDQAGLLTMATYQRTALGIVVDVGGARRALALLLPFRAHLSIALPALLFVLPALVGVVIGGFVPGVVGALGGFVFYDLFFLPPYNTLTVRSPQNWVALLVYVVVVLVVAQVVAKLQSAREEAERRTGESQRLYELSQALIGDLKLSQLLTHMVDHGAVRLRSTLDDAGGA